MPTPVAGPLRLARAALVATLVLALTAGAHAVAGGHLPDPLVLAALGALTLAGTVLAARARFTAPRLVALLGGAQLALHVALDTLGHGAAVCVAGARRVTPPTDRRSPAPRRAPCPTPRRSSRRPRTSGRWPPGHGWSRRTPSRPSSSPSCWHGGSERSNASSPG
ncbi:hypothetical protein [Cellulosimicrobium sp. CUA-896]|uniref:hypothetical protein n=1 Tax=Cellulosimicrobium sp. CUA-896 TaxID=1517881 RepID=UPI0011151073|nr:hypothetical protein [Cellulosimicrobium sp. CUA-896]